MRINTMKRKLEAGRSVLGVGAGLGAPLSVEVLSLAGFDFVLVDNQHGAWDDDSSMLAYRSILFGEATPMVRVPQNDYYAIGRMLDRGAFGIVVPMVNSAEEAAEAARAVRYPPEGGRSIGPFGTAILGSDYVAAINREVYLAVQIESWTAVQSAEAILAVEGVDGCWVGPGDLGLSMGKLPVDPHKQPEVEAAILSVVEACHKTGKVPGIAGTPETAAHWLDKGFRFVTVGADSSLLSAKATEVLGELRSRS